MEKTTKDLTQTDWAMIHRQGRWNVNYNEIVYQKYFGVEKIGDISYNKHNGTLVTSLMLRFVIEDFLKQNNFVVDHVLDIGHDGDYPPSFSNIEYEPKKYKSCLQTGTMFLKNGDQKYVLNLDPTQDGIIFTFISRKDATPNGQEWITKLVQYANDNNYLKGKKIDPECRFIYFDNPYSWDDLILDDKTRVAVRQNLSNLFKYKEIYQKNNINIKRGVIFEGPPGTGKSLLGKIICTTTTWTFVWVTPKFLTKTSDIADIVGICRDLSPSVLFLEDIDLYGGAREQNANAGLLGELMNQLDGIQENKDIITIATTNNVEVLEKALLDRPGRFDKVIKFDAPSDAVRKEMIRAFMKKSNIGKDVDLDELAKLTEGLTGAQIREFINMSLLLAVDDESYDENQLILVQPKHFKRSVSSVKRKDFSKAVGFGNASSPSNDDDFPFDLDRPHHW